MPPLSPPAAPSPAHGGDASTSEASDDPSHTLKRDYLSLLPQTQIVEICLALDRLASQHARESVWPADLQSAIQTLKSSATGVPPTSAPPPAAELPPPLDQQVEAVLPQQHAAHPPAPVNEHAVPPMASLRDDSVPQPTTILSAERAASRPPQDNGPSTAGPSTVPSRSQSVVSSPAPQSASIAQPHTPYPYAPYGFVPKAPPQQPAYPHTPYYATPPPVPPGYPSHYPYGAYPPPPGYPSTSNGYPTYPPAASPHPGPMTEQPPPNHSFPPMPPAEDLPSYEEMIVEALMDTNDPDGTPPKDLFAWMAARYPLQTNFRPSASQALQKAFKRGRLEKLPGGKYRLNPSWEGGTTSKRTTRKPQTLAQTTYAMQHPPQPPSSPFTNAPLHHRPNHASYPQPGGPPGQYPGYAYGYAPPGYPPYSAPSAPPFYQQQHPTTASKSPVSGPSITPAPATPHAPPASGGKDGADKAEGHDANAWEAAQHILQAINFSALERSEEADLPQAHSAEATSGGASAEAESAPRTTLTEEERASLQAQLALLAAQLTEIANASEDEDEDDEEDDDGVQQEVGERAQQAFHQPSEADVQMQHEPTSDPKPLEAREDTVAAAPEAAQFPTDLSSEDAGRAMAMLLDNLDSAAQAMAQEAEEGEEEEESDEDEDMEMVEVPTYVESDALRT